MPQKTEPQSTTQSIEIPDKVYKWLVKNGYSGPKIVSSDQAHQYVKQYNKAHSTGDGGGGDNGVTINIPGSGGSGGSAGLTQKQKNNLRNSYLDLLDKYGIDLDANLKKLIEQGVNQEWSTTSFRMHLKGTIEYKRQFPGIGRQDGMSEAEYNARFRAYNDKAKDAGFHLSREQFGTLLTKGVEIDEWRARMGFFRRATRDRKFFQDLEQVAKARGLIKPHEKFNLHDLWNIMTHRGSPQIERLLEESNVQFNLESVGLTIGKHGDLRRKELLAFIKHQEGAGTQVESNALARNYADLAKQIKTVLPAAEQIGAGITKHDLFILEFGGHGQEEIARFAEAILRSKKIEDSGQALAKTPIEETQTGHTSIGGAAIRRPERL